VGWGLSCVEDWLQVFQLCASKTKTKGTLLYDCPLVLLLLLLLHDPNLLLDTAIDVSCSGIFLLSLPLHCISAQNSHGMSSEKGCV
jgi:hypothetical protein